MSTAESSTETQTPETKLLERIEGKMLPKTTQELSCARKQVMAFVESARMGTQRALSAEALPTGMGENITQLCNQVVEIVSGLHPQEDADASTAVQQMEHMMDRWAELRVVLNQLDRALESRANQKVTLQGKITKLEGHLPKEKEKDDGVLNADLAHPLRGAALQRKQRETEAQKVDMLKRIEQARAHIAKLSTENSADSFQAYIDQILELLQQSDPVHAEIRKPQERFSQMYQECLLQQAFAKQAEVQNSRSVLVEFVVGHIASLKAAYYEELAAIREELNGQSIDGAVLGKELTRRLGERRLRPTGTALNEVYSKISLTPELAFENIAKLRAEFSQKRESAQQSLETMTEDQTQTRRALAALQESGKPMPKRKVRHNANIFDGIDQVYAQKFALKETDIALASLNFTLSVAHPILAIKRWLKKKGDKAEK